MPGRGPAGAKVNFRQAPPVGAKGNCQAPLSSTKIGLVDIPNVDPYEPPSPNQIEEMIPGHAPVGWSGKFNDELGRLADLIYAGREFYLLVLAADIRNSTLVQNEAIDLRLHAAVLSRFVQVSGEAIQKVYGGWFDKFTGDAHSPCNVVGHKTGRRDLVLDPMCGIGTTLVEAVHLGRVAVGVEYEQEWADLARANSTMHERAAPPGTARSSPATRYD